jgi:hypothetical protein
VCSARGPGGVDAFVRLFGWLSPRLYRKESSRPSYTVKEKSKDTHQKGKMFCFGLKSRDSFPFFYKICFSYWLNVCLEI